MKNLDKIFMQRAIKLAKNGSNIVYNIPIFGYVLVINNLIIKEGWNQIYKNYYFTNNKNFFLERSTLYLTLEPYYKNTSFINFILKYKIPKVVIGIRNPYNKNSGLVIKILKSSGVKVFENILINECYEINKKIFTFYKKKRPFIVLKWTQSLNGIICNNNIRKDNLNKEFYNQLTDKWRIEEESILFDIKNILYNNLLLKYWYGKNPIIIILDKNLIIPNNHFIFHFKNKIIFFTEKKINFFKKNIIFLRLKFDKNLLYNIIYELYKKNIKSIIIEDQKNIEFFIQNKIWDEAKISIYDIFLNKGIKAPNIIGKIVYNVLFFNEKIIIIRSNNI